MSSGGEAVRCAPGVHFGSLYVGGLMTGQMLDILPEKLLSKVRNLDEFAGILCVDKLMSNADWRQVVFRRTQCQHHYTATFIDQGACFHSQKWCFSDEPTRGVYPDRSVYKSVTGWDSFEPWLSKLEALELDTLMGIADDVPQEWCRGQASLLRQLMERLWSRRCKVRDLISAYRKSDVRPFPNWTQVTKSAAPTLTRDEQNFPSWEEVAQSVKLDLQQDESGGHVLKRKCFAS